MLTCGQTRVLALLTLLLLGSDWAWAQNRTSQGRTTSKPLWGAKATRFMKGRIQVKNGRPYINVRTFGKHYKEQESWSKSTENTVELRFDPHLNVGHTTIRVGQIEYQMLGSRAASGNGFANSNILASSAGAVFRVRSKDIKKIATSFNQVVVSANKHNFPAFSINGRTLTVKQHNGGWEIQNTKRRAETRVIEAGLVKHAGKEFLESPNGYRQPVLGRSTGPDGKLTLQVASKSCTSFVLDTLNAADSSSMPKIQPTASARGLARALLSSNARGPRPDAVVHYSVEGKMPRDLPAAV
jgi:hypothetical protein